MEHHYRYSMALESVLNSLYYATPYRLDHPRPQQLRWSEVRYFVRYSYATHLASVRTPQARTYTVGFADYAMKPGEWQITRVRY